jgi:hypothetical protein
VTEAELHSVRGRTLEAGRRVASFVRAHPLEMAAAAAGAGFLLGGGLTRRVGTLLLGVDSRFAAARIGEWITDQSAAAREAGSHERGSRWNDDTMNEIRKMGGTRS